MLHQTQKDLTNWRGMQPKRKIVQDVCEWERVWINKFTWFTKGTRLLKIKKWQASEIGAKELATKKRTFLNNARHSCCLIDNKKLLISYWFSRFRTEEDRIKQSKQKTKQDASEHTNAIVYCRLWKLILQKGGGRVCKMQERSMSLHRWWMI